jgi:hypothetical protein
MKLPQELKKTVVTELEFIARRMKEEEDPSKKIFYYSAVKGALERVQRYHYDKELLISVPITEISYALINDRVNHLKGGDTMVPITEEMLNALIEGVLELKQTIENDQVTYPAIEKLMEVAYSSTGPGFYTRSFLDSVAKPQQGQEERR